MKIILASRSENRAECLRIAGLKFEVKPADIPEHTIEHPDPQKRVVLVAEAKGRTIASRQTKALVIAADTFGVYRNTLMEKSKFRMDALDTLKTLSGRSHTMLTGWAVYNTDLKTHKSGFVETKVTFRDIDDDVLTGYVNDHMVLDWAAAYSPANTKALSFVEKVEGSLTGFLYGVPLEKIMPLLEEWGGV